MKFNFTHYLVVFAFSLFFIGCTKHNIFSGRDFSEFAINSVTKYGNFEKDVTLNAYTIPCQDNTTFRMYYSDSAAILGLHEFIHIVSYQKAGHLAYNEVYLEVTTSTVDTYLSTGMPGNEYDNQGPDHEWGFDTVTVQHFTSAPQPDSTTVSATFRPL